VGFGNVILYLLFLFLFVADDLSALLKRRVQLNEVVPIKVCPRASGVSRLLFADDTLIFFQASQEQAQRVSDTTDAYASATGQLINREKCSITFGESCSSNI
jgi:hypothetical protein